MSTNESQEKPTLVECPFADNGITKGLKELTKKGGLLERTIIEVKQGNELTRESNELTKKNSRLLRLVVLLFLAAVLLLLVVGFLAYFIFGGVGLVENNLNRSIQKQDQLVSDVRKLVEQQKKTDDKVDAIKEDQEEQPKVEIVAEQDPEKAKDVPFKVRITPGKKPDKEDATEPATPPTQTTVEVPLPVKDAKTLQEK